MEVVLAVLLFFGGVTLGSITAGNGDESSPSNRIQLDGDRDSALRPVTRPTREYDLLPCPSNGAVIYRDLTVPTGNQMDAKVNQTGDCEGACPDE